MKNLIRSINRSPLCCGFFTIAIALCWFALAPPLRAADCPTECGAGGNTAVGVNALDSVNPAIGLNNTAVDAISPAPTFPEVLAKMCVRWTDAFPKRAAPDSSGAGK